jgi:hypothetical protein
VTTVSDVVLDVSGNPLPAAAVRIALVASTSPGAQVAYTSAGTVVAPIALTADNLGRWSTNLTPNSQITPANTYYQVYEGNAPVSTIVVPAAGGPYTVAQLVVAPPTLAAPGITGVVALGWVSVKDWGAKGDGVTDDTAAITAAITALAAGGTLFFPTGNYLTTGVLIQGKTRFEVRGGRGATLLVGGPTVAAPARATANALTVADCSDFAITGLSIDGRRDTVQPLLTLAASATAGQPSIQVGHGLAAAYVVGQKLNLCGGLTANGATERDQQDKNKVIASITPGGGAAADTITFTTNLAANYTFSASAALSDGFGPYAAPGAYVTPWQTGAATVAGRALAEEDQQNGIHLIHCQRFSITGCAITGMWENSIRLGTHLLDGTAQNDGCTDGAIVGNVISHGYDQGVAVWCSQRIAVADNVINAAGWAGICLTMGDDCTVSGNVSAGNVQRIPGDNVSSGHGVAIEGGIRNTVTGNKLQGNFGAGVMLTAAGTTPFGSPPQVATAITSGSNNAVLPQATINVASAAALAAAGSVTVLSNAGAQQVFYTGKTGTTLTGCTGGIGTLLTGQPVAQYGLFLANGATLEVGSTTATISDGTKVQVGGSYSILDGPRTERITVLTVVGNVITMLPTRYRHLDKLQLGQATAQANVIIANSMDGNNNAGVMLASAVDTNVSDNVIDRSGLRGVDGVIWTAGGLVAPTGTVVAGNTITAPDTTADGAAYQAVAFQQAGDWTVRGNRIGGSLATTGYFNAIHAQGGADWTIEGNQISDVYANGIRIDDNSGSVPLRGKIIGNTVDRCIEEGILLWTGDSLVVLGNTVGNSASNAGPGGFGGGFNIRGVVNSQFVGNVCEDCGRGGFGLDSANALTCQGNTFLANIARSSGFGVDPFNGSTVTQGSGFKELSGGQGPNTYIGNIASGNTTNWSITSAGNKLSSNAGYNPVGKFGSQPAVPASTVAQTNDRNADATVYVVGGTVTVIAVGGQATGLTAGAVRVPAGQSITLTYSVAPTWTWFGD